MTAYLSADSFVYIDFSKFPHEDPKAIEEVKKGIAMNIRKRIAEIQGEYDYCVLRSDPSLSREQLEWVRTTLLTKEERKRLTQAIKNNPLPKPVAEGDEVCDRKGQLMGVVSKVTRDSLYVGEEEMSWEDFEVMGLAKFEPKLEAEVEQDAVGSIPLAVDIFNSKAKEPIEVRKVKEYAASIFGVDTEYIGGHWGHGFDNVRCWLANVEVKGSVIVGFVWDAMTGKIEVEPPHEDADNSDAAAEVREILECYLNPDSQVTELEPTLEPTTEQLQTWADQIALAEDTEAPVAETEIAGTSDDDEVERLVTKINELDRNYIFEVGGCLLRLKEVWSSSAEHPDFDSFCLARLGKRYSETHRNDLINAAKLQAVLPETATAVLGDSLNATKPLASMLYRKVEPEKIQEVIEEVAASGSITRDAVENAAIAKGYLPQKRKPTKPKAESEVIAQGQSLGLSGKESRQLPSIKANADIPPVAAISSLSGCATMEQVRAYCMTRTKAAVTELKSLCWQDRFRLRGICPDMENLLVGAAIEQGINADGLLTLLDADKDSKIEWLENRVQELEANEAEGQRWYQKYMQLKSEVESERKVA